MPMPDQLKTVVQRMIDAGESEENIAAVIRRFKSADPEMPSVIRRRVTSDSSEPEPGWFASLSQDPALQAAAHPQTLGDFASLLIPNGAEQVLSRMVAPATAAASKYGGAAVDAITGLLPKTAQKGIDVLRELNPSQWNSPLTAAGRDARATNAAVTRGADMYTMRRGQYAPNDAAAKAPYTESDAIPEGLRRGVPAPKGMPSGPLRERYPNGLPIEHPPELGPFPTAEEAQRGLTPPTAARPAESPNTPPPTPAESTPAAKTAAQKRGRGNAPQARKRGTTPAANQTEITLSGEEAKQAQKWLEAGVSPDTVAERILNSRSLTQKLGTPTPDQAVRAVADRNASGRWPE